ncbi:MAG: glycosyltransferase family 4 protein [Victivallales bacterium]|nr:glycosyltransferase family 4 protein [Victivallales bacterium]
MPDCNILYIGGPTGFAGGIERYACQTASLLRSSGSHVTWCGFGEDVRDSQIFLSAFDRSANLEQVLAEPDNYALVALHKLPNINTLNALREKYGERLVFWAHDHDLYCPRRHYYTPFGRANCHRAFAPLRCWLCSHVTRPHNWNSLHSDHFALLSELKDHHAVVLSDFMAKNLQKNGFDSQRTHLIHPAIPISDYNSNLLNIKNLNIIFIGQLIRGKGADLLLEALAILRIPWHAKIVGDGPDRPLLENLASRLGIRDHLEFTGWQEKPEELLPQSDVAVFPSRWQEPFGLAGAEAQAHALPVVAFDVGGVREWLEDGVTGFVVPPKDTQAMADRLAELFQDPTLRHSLGENARRHMQEHFSPKHFLDSFQQLVEAVSQ